MHSIGLGLLRLVTWGICVDIYVTNLLMDGEKACPVSVLVTRIYSEFHSKLGDRKLFVLRESQRAALRTY